jgi:hypothetical protein
MLGPIRAPFAPPLRTATHVDVPSRSSPPPPCMAATPTSVTPARHYRPPTTSKNRSSTDLTPFPRLTLGHALPCPPCHCPLLPSSPITWHCDVVQGCGPCERTTGVRLYIRKGLRANEEPAKAYIQEGMRTRTRGRTNARKLQGIRTSNGVYECEGLGGGVRTNER